MKTIIKSTIVVAIMTLSFCSAVAQQRVPIMEKGTKTSVLFNKKGTKRLDIEILDITYSDSTYNKCKATITFQFTAIGKEIPLFKYVWLESYYSPRLKFSYNKDLPMEKLGKSLAENQSIIVNAEIFLEETFFVQFDNLYLLALNKYEGGKIVEQKEEERRLALQRQREENRKREIIIQDSLKLAKQIEFYAKVDNTTILKNFDAEQVSSSIMWMSQDSVRAKLKHFKHEFGEYSDVFYIYSKHENKKIPLEVNYREAVEDKKKRVSYMEFISRNSSDPYQGWGLSPSEKVWLKFHELKFKSDLKKELKSE